MINIAICDDEKEICSIMEQTILDYKNTNKIKVDIDVFYCGEELQNSLKQGQRYDLIFLDIEMEKINGIDVGEFIRKEMQDEIVQIAYISSKTSYAMKLFKNRPIDFLIKPISEESIIETIDKVLIIFNKNVKCFEFLVGKNAYKILYKDIIYFESLDRKVTIHTTTKTYEFYDKLAKIASKVLNGDFIYIHKSFIANYTYIETAYYEKLVMTTGESLPISQRNRKAVREALYNCRKARNNNE